MTAEGVMGDFTSSTAIIEGDPQKSQRWATRVGSKMEIALQFWQRTDFFVASHPRWLSGMDFSAATRSLSWTAVGSFLNSAGDTVLQ